MITIGLTGGLKTGKSTVARCFEKLGAERISADEIVHEALEPQGACARAVERAFGADVVRDGRIDRRALGRLVFSDERQRRKLERILHPFVRRTIERQLRIWRREKPGSVVVLEIPLLFEARPHYKVNATVVVSASQKQQIERAVRQLGISKAEALRRIRAQMPLKEKIRRADFVINNNHSIQDTQKQVRTLWLKMNRKI